MIRDYANSVTCTLQRRDEMHLEVNVGSADLSRGGYTNRQNDGAVVAVAHRHRGKNSIGASNVLLPGDREKNAVDEK